MILLLAVSAALSRNPRIGFLAGNTDTRKWARVLLNAWAQLSELRASAPWNFAFVPRFLISYEKNVKVREYDTNGNDILKWCVAKFGDTTCDFGLAMNTAVQKDGTDTIKTEHVFKVCQRKEHGTQSRAFELVVAFS